jgi:Na+/H+ antiporter NhaD/arsenite permease-like protein
MTEIISLIIPSIASIAVVLGWLYFFIRSKLPHEVRNSKDENIIITVALFSIIFFVASLTTAIIFTASIDGYLFILGWFLMLISVLSFFWNRPSGL